MKKAIIITTISCFIGLILFAIVFDIPLIAYLFSREVITILVFGVLFGVFWLLFRFAKKAVIPVIVIGYVISKITPKIAMQQPVKVVEPADLFWIFILVFFIVFMWLSEREKKIKKESEGGER